MKKIIMTLLLCASIFVAGAQAVLHTYLAWNTKLVGTQWMRSDTVSYYTEITFIDDDMYIDGDTLHISGVVESDTALYMYSMCAHGVPCAITFRPKDDVATISLQFPTMNFTFALIKRKKDDDGTN